MTTMTTMTTESDERRLGASLLWRCLWHWDLWAATAVGAAAAVFWALTDHEPGWGWFGTIIVVSVTLGGIAWNQWNSVSSRLRGSAYGELVRIADQTETTVELPYLVTRRVSFASALCSIATAVVIQIQDAKLAEVPLVGLTGLLAAWSILGVVSLSEHSSRHNKMMAEMEAILEETAAAERLYKAEQQQAQQAETTTEETG